MAGIPVCSRRGKNGGISLMERFVLDRMLISDREQREILAALASLEETGAGAERLERMRVRYGFAELFVCSCFGVSRPPVRDRAEERDKR